MGIWLCQNKNKKIVLVRLVRGVAPGTLVVPVLENSNRYPTFSGVLSGLQMIFCR